MRTGEHQNARDAERSCERVTFAGVRDPDQRERKQERELGETDGYLAHALIGVCFLVFEMAASKNGISAREVERKYGLCPRSAWFALHRLREAMKRGSASDLLSGRIVADHEVGQPRRTRPTSQHPPRCVPGGLLAGSPHRRDVRPLATIAASRRADRAASQLPHRSTSDDPGSRPGPSLQS
jgi:hypothetical protein